MSLFEDIQPAPPIEVFAVSEACQRDPEPDKVNLTVGAYRTNEGLPWVLPCVRSVELSMAKDEKFNKEYLPVTGLGTMCVNALKILLGENNPLIAEKKADGCQSLGGTGALYLGMQFLSRVAKYTTLYVSRPTWVYMLLAGNHKMLASLAGLHVQDYRYWDSAKLAVDFDGMLEDIKNAPSNSIILLHACAHNPTGMDLSREQWMQLAIIMKEKALLPMFDIAYQGFASGDLNNDAWAVRYFASLGMELFAAQSFSKNFGLYNERVGNLAFITNDAKYTANIKSQLTILVRKTWSNPPQHGARIVDTILNDPQLCAQWKADVATMANRIKEMRQALYTRLLALKVPGSWEHIVNQIGMFAYTGLSAAQAEHMRTKHHIYLLNDGRINICGLTTKNVEYVANAIYETLMAIPN
ncbi:hypothetical protein T265_01360 [Opisthorchis viverrini]|uniref:Aspartate aminotransferase n=2 Tax=Opisthorchis viverrini TaxID=6198 RepID=A0A075AAB3_OPIVI|nr:hypothetical protein T265_01360 [Opisthorchis viverrini]KER32680.1 hypothetical protein T265_01360 [Opisthorchis viverrini]